MLVALSCVCGAGFVCLRLQCWTRPLRRIPYNPIYPFTLFRIYSKKPNRRLVLQSNCSNRSTGPPSQLVPKSTGPPGQSIPSVNWSPLSTSPAVNWSPKSIAHDNQLPPVNWFEQSTGPQSQLVPHVNWSSQSTGLSGQLVRQCNWYSKSNSLSSHLVRPVNWFPQCQLVPTVSTSSPIQLVPQSTCLQFNWPLYLSVCLFVAPGALQDSYYCLYCCCSQLNWYHIADP